MPADCWRIMPARSISRCETISASLGVRAGSAGNSGTGASEYSLNRTMRQTAHRFRLVQRHHRRLQNANANACTMAPARQMHIDGVCAGRQRLANLAFSLSLDDRRNEGRHIAAHRSDLAHQRRGDVARLRRRGQQHGLQVRAPWCGSCRRAASRRSRSEPSRRPRIKNQWRRSALRRGRRSGRRRSRPPARSCHSRAASGTCNGAQQLGPLLARRRSASCRDGRRWRGPTCRPAQAHAASIMSEMAVGDGVERPGIESCAAHRSRVSVRAAATARRFGRGEPVRQP
jgi:hypothetical protein